MAFDFRGMSQDEKERIVPSIRKITGALAEMAVDYDVPEKKINKLVDQIDELLESGKIGAAYRTMERLGNLIKEDDDAEPTPDPSPGDASGATPPATPPHSYDDYLNYLEETPELLGEDGEPAATKPMPTYQQWVAETLKQEGNQPDSSQEVETADIPTALPFADLPMARALTDEEEAVRIANQQLASQDYAAEQDRQQRKQKQSRQGRNKFFSSIGFPQFQKWDEVMDNWDQWQNPSGEDFSGSEKPGNLTSQSASNDALIKAIEDLTKELREVRDAITGGGEVGLADNGNFRPAGMAPLGAQQADQANRPTRSNAPRGRISTREVDPPGILRQTSRGR